MLPKVRRSNLKALLRVSVVKGYSGTNTNRIVFSTGDDTAGYAFNHAYPSACAGYQGPSPVRRLCTLTATHPVAFS